jgi:hypothetical protein
MEKNKNSDQSSPPKGMVITMTYPEINERLDKISLLYLESYMQKEESIARFLSDEEEHTESMDESVKGEFTVIYRSNGFRREGRLDY